VLSTGFLTALLLASTLAAPPKLGDVAPDFRLLDQKAEVVRLSHARGRKAVIVFYRGYW
jgi:peroxiredoxin